MRKLLTSVAAIVVAGLSGYGAIKAANLSLFGNISLQEPSQELAALNTLIQAINSGVTGQYAFVPGPVGNTGTGTTTQNFVFASATIPTGTLVAAGQGFRARCAGTSNGATNVNYGIAVGKAIAVSLQTGGTGNSQGTTQPNWDLEIQWQAATNPVTASYTWMGRAFASTTTGVLTQESMAITSGLDTNATDNNAIFAIPVSCVMYNGAATAITTMQNFEIEAIR